jgi:hypothetical protein
MIELEFMIAGVKFHQAQYDQADVKNGDLLELLPEPENQKDPNAIKVLKGGIQIGYVPRALCVSLLLAISNGTELRTEVTNAWSKGCSVKVSSSE